ncbi:MAG: hypothetical protein P4L77_11980 [Sulfuriferula sp.]|nr:hypothetical protein [Sulfuriferula sp.]
MSFSSEPGLRHTWLTGPWHYCDRCDKKTKIAEMKWERGLLLGPECQDTRTSKIGLLGERDVKIAQVLTDGKQEFVPVEKIRHPDWAETIEDFLV